MRKETQRKIAISAARSYLREQGIDPLACDSEDALIALDDLSRLDSDLTGSQWYLAATDNQVKLFRREWRKWRKGWIATNRIVRLAYRRLETGNVKDLLSSLDELDAQLAAK